MIQSYIILQYKTFFKKQSIHLSDPEINKIEI